MKRQRQWWSPKAASQCFLSHLQPFGCLQTHSCLRLLHKHPSGHPDVGQRKQRDQLCRVLLQSPITHLGVAELALDHSKRMLHLGTDAGLEFLGLLNELAPGRVLLLLALVRAHGYVPIHARRFCSLSRALIPGVGKYHFFLAIGRCRLK